MSDRPPTHTPPTHTPPGIGAARRWYYALWMLQLVMFIVLAVVWFATFPRIHFVWFGCALFAVALLSRQLGMRKVVCPNCKARLIGQYRVDLYAKACHHCGHPFR